MLNTPYPFQQKVKRNPSTYQAYEVPDLGNFRFCADNVCNTQLNAWLESCTPSCTPTATSASAWVELTSSIAGSGGTLTIYFVLQSLSTTFDGNFWGEAPNIPGTYGTNDNGANVFNSYDNFAGTTLSNKWTTVKSSGGSVAVNNRANFYNFNLVRLGLHQCCATGLSAGCRVFTWLGGRRGCRARGVTYFVTETVMSRSTTDQFSLFTVLEKVFFESKFPHTCKH